MPIYSPEKIIALREERGWNTSELARRARLSAPSVWALEQGQTKMPKFSTMERIARALGVPISAIMSDKPSGELNGRIEEVVDLLTPANKHALFAAAVALLTSQTKK